MVRVPFRNHARRKQGMQQRCRHAREGRLATVLTWTRVRSLKYVLALIDRRSKKAGSPLSRAARSEAFREVLDENLAANFGPVQAWERLPVLCCGMVGSRQGWAEAGYVRAPCDAKAVAKAITWVPNPKSDSNRRIGIISGVDWAPATAGASSARRPHEAPDVMRGEETQLIGAVEAMSASGELRKPWVACLPGTHTKWVDMRGGFIARFASYMTGELFEVVTRHSLLSKSVGEPTASESDRLASFDSGILCSKQPGGLAMKLFSTRRADLCGALCSDRAGAYVSGMLIGDEVRAASVDFLAPQRDSETATPVVLIGSSAHVQRYARALKAFGFASTALGDTSARGLIALGRKLGFVSGVSGKASAL